MHDGSIRIDPPLYVAHTMISCWRCRVHMPVIALVTPNVPEAEGEVCILSQVEELPNDTQATVCGPVSCYPARAGIWISRTGQYRTILPAG